MSMEILAPAGSTDALIAGVRCGANAVYLGMKNINARRNAANFGTEELASAVKYCHERNVKVYVTLNILVSDEELETAVHTAEKAINAGADGFIVQDLGLAKILHEQFPKVRLHASTQCSVNSPEGFKALEEAGFVRAVIPREMSLEEIKEIRKATDMELELFVHGALCMSVSGQCYMSAMLGGRSGNRGLCAQPCRLPFSADESKSCDLSLKDLSLLSHLKEIEEAGVCSLKIEGRMKRPEYVASAVTSCKKALLGEYLPNDETVLKSVFSRSGFTDGYFTGKRQDMFGYRQKEDVIAAKDVLKELSHLYDNETPLVPIKLDFICRENEPIKLSATALGKTVTATGSVPEKAINKPMTEESLGIRLKKFGNTQYYPTEVNITLDDGLIVKASEINGLRREVTELLNEQSNEEKVHSTYHLEKDKRKADAPYYTARFADPEAIPDRHPFKRIFIPVWCKDEDFVDNRAGVELPRALFSCEDKLTKRLEHLKKIGVKKALCSNLGAYRLAEKYGFEAYGDFGLNIFNSETARLFNSPIISFEATLEQINSIDAKDKGIIAYGTLPLMLTRNCPIKNHIGCQNCTGRLTDRKGFEFKVKCSPYPCVEIFNPLPLYMADRQREINCDFLHFYFTDENKKQVEEIISNFENGTKLDKKYTRGLYYRGVE